MEQDRWEKESERDHKSFKSIIVLGLVAVAIIGIAIFSCGKTKVNSLSLDKGHSVLGVDHTDMLYETVEPKDAHPILLWKSSDESIATVMNGLVTGRKGGKVTITVTVKDQEDISAKCEYVIEEQDIDIETLDILEEPLVLRPGGHQQMNVSVTPKNQNEKILWSSTDESVARVNPRGKVEAVKIGVAYIIAESERTGVKDSALVSVEGAGVMPNMATPKEITKTTTVTVTKVVPAKSTPAQPTKPVQSAKPAQTAKPASTAKPTQAAKPAQTTVTKATPSTAAKAVPVKSTPAQPAKPAQTTKPVQTSKPAQTATTKATPSTTTKTSAKTTTPVQATKPVTKTPAKSSASGLKNFGYANYRGSWPNDVNGRMEFKSTHVIDSKDPKGRIASPGDYVIGEWSDGHLVQGIWYGSDNQVKGSILIGK